MAYGRFTMDHFISTHLHNKVKMKKITKIWIILLVLTLFAFSLGQFKMTNNYFIFLLLVTTFFKGLLVIDYFMKLSEVQLKYRIVPILWLSATLFLISLAYYNPLT